MKESPANEIALKQIRDADSFAEMSLSLHLIGEGMVLTMFRFSEYIAPTEADKKMFRLIMQDEARHVGYGLQHLKWVMRHFPEKREIIHKHLDEAENMVFSGGYALEGTEPVIVLACKGLEQEDNRAGGQLTPLYQIMRPDG